MSKHLKNFLFSLLILVTPYMNYASNAMNEADYDGSTVRARKVSFVEEDRQDVLSFSKPSTTSNVVNLEDSKISWTSYLSSPFIGVAQGAYDVLDYTTRNPNKAMVIGAILFYQVAAITAVAAEDECLFNCGNQTADMEIMKRWGEVPAPLPDHRLATEMWWYMWELLLFPPRF